MNYSSYSQIIANIQDIYDKFRVPEKFQGHMRVVGDNARLLAQQFNNEKILLKGLRPNIPMPINTQLLQSAGYVHDLGNILKVTNENVHKYKGMEEDWQSRRNIAQEFGDSPLEATLNMQNSLAMNSDIQRLTKYMEPHNFHNIAKLASQTYLEHVNVLIMAYADATASPFGPASLEVRRDEAKNRLGECKEIDEFYQYLKVIENKLKTHIEIPYEFIDIDPN